MSQQLCSGTGDNTQLLTAIYYPSEQSLNKDRLLKLESATSRIKLGSVALESTKYHALLHDIREDAFM